jgi:hypothetical protein
LVWRTRVSAKWPSLLGVSAAENTSNPSSRKNILVQDTGKWASDIGKIGGIKITGDRNMFPFYCSYSFVLYYLLK